MPVSAAKDIVISKSIGVGAEKWVFTLVKKYIELTIESLEKELETNVGMKIDFDSGDNYEVSGR